MKTTRYETMFAHLQAKKEGAFIPFVVLGDPDAETCLSVIDTLIEHGADALELGIPFSDAVADGPVIQQAGYRALEGGVTPTHCWQMLKRIRAKHPDVPIGLLVYANLVVHRDVKAFYKEAAEADVDSVLVADVPIGASALFVEAADETGIAPIFIVAPNADETVIREIARQGRGYTYFLGRAGVTGADREMQTLLSSRFEALQAAGAAPAIVGFGISTPEHIRAALAAGAAGVIAGSATVSIIEQHLDDKAAMCEALATFVRKMKAATRRS
ncbi:MAG: tryptophan synthase subunit alpha [Burkholderiales bacterium]|jgi:tryptophan synthase alpha chain|nr:tryptophan synthase subunit alpha [Burkholderiales bacterium]